MTLNTFRCCVNTTLSANPSGLSACRERPNVVRCVALPVLGASGPHSAPHVIPPAGCGPKISGSHQDITVRTTSHLCQQGMQNLVLNFYDFFCPGKVVLVGMSCNTALVQFVRQPFLSKQPFRHQKCFICGRHSSASADRAPSETNFFLVRRCAHQRTPDLQV